MAALPRCVHFVAQTPYFDVMWFFCAVSDAKITEVRTAGEVAVFQKIPCFLLPTGAEINGHHGFGSNLTAP